MSFPIQRLAWTASVVALAIAAASAGVLLWRHLNPPPIEVRTTLPPLAGLPQAPAGPELSVGDRRPDFSLPDTDGVTRSVSEWDGKLLFLNFWATWCPPCLEEIPGFMRLQAEYGGRGVQFLGVALDGAENVRRFMTELGMNYPSLHGERDAIELGRRYGNRIGALPYTVVVAPDGRVARMHQGLLAEDDARSLIEEAL